MGKFVISLLLVYRLILLILAALYFSVMKVSISIPLLFLKVVSLHVRSNLLDGEGLFTPNGYEPRKCQATTDTPPSELNYVHMLNQNLPEDIWVLSWCPVSEEFSARFVQRFIPT